MIVWGMRVKVIRAVQWCVVYHNVHSYKHTHMSSSYRCNRGWACWFRFSLGFLCFSYLGPAYFSVFGAFSLVHFELSVPVQVIAWKDLSPK